MVAIDVGRCFCMGYLVRPGQMDKWPILMDLRRVAVCGLKDAPWRKADSSDFSFCINWCCMIYYHRVAL